MLTWYLFLTQSFNYLVNKSMKTYKIMKVHIFFTDFLTLKITAKTE